MIPAAKAGVRTVDAKLPISGISESRIVITMKASVIAIHTHGDAAKRRQPSVHHARPLPAATLAGGSPPAASTPAEKVELERGGVGSAMGASRFWRGVRYGSTPPNRARDRARKATDRSR